MLESVHEDCGSTIRLSNELWLVAIEFEAKQHQDEDKNGGIKVLHVIRCHCWRSVVP